MTPEQRAEMAAWCGEAMEAGALGLSSGLEFDPGRTATREEMVDLVAVVGRYGGLYTSHIRNRDALQEAVDEFLEVGRRAGRRASSPI